MKKNVAVALCALCVGLGGWVQASVAQSPPKDPFVFKSAKNVRIVRAVAANGQLYIFYFVHHNGVWWLLGARLASSLPSGAPKA